MRYVMWAALPLLALLVYVRTVRPAVAGRRGRALCGVVILAGLFSPLAAKVWGGSTVAPLMPPAALLTAEFFLFLLLFMGKMTLVREAVAWGLRRWLGWPAGTLARSRRLTIFILLLGLGANDYGMHQALALPEVKRVEVVLPELPPALEGLTIAQLSDLHVSLLFRAERVKAIVDAVNALSPDIVAITGDLVDGDVADRAGDLAPLANLSAPYGVWGCEGNHEHYVDYPGWRAFLPTLNIKMLYNAHGVVTVKGTPLVVAGLTDLIADKFDDEGPQLAKALAGAPEAFTLLLAHQPKLADRVAGRGPALQLAGHTHGGQLPGVNLLTKVLNAGYLAGLYRVTGEKGTMALYVNSGTDLWNGFAIRIGTTGEITLLTLKSGCC